MTHLFVGGCCLGTVQKHAICMSSERQKRQKKANHGIGRNSSAQRWLTLKLGHGGGLGLAHLFCARRLFRDGQDQVMCTHQSTVTPTYDVFRCSKLDTGGRVARHIFLREEVVQGRSKSGVIARQVEISKNSKKGRSTKSAVTPTHNAG